MKKLYLLLSVCLIAASSFNITKAQCTVAYPNSAQLNWDNLDYYYNSGLNVAPYGYRISSTSYTYVSNTMEQTQRFALGTNTVTFTISAAGVADGENAVHTGNLAGYTGEDAMFTPSATNQTIVMTFASPVWNPNFTLYDIDANAAFTITATNNLNVATAVNAVPQGSTILSIGAVPLTRTVGSSGSSLADNSNQGSATITVPGAVNSITIRVNTVGSDPDFYMSDLNACVSASFPTNYHQLANNRPFVGPTQNMPDYFLVTPDNDGAYMVDPVGATARLLFNDPAKDYINSFGYDPYNRYLYYITENPSVDYTNKQIKRYNYNTETSSVFIADITAAPLNIPTFNGGVESAGCAFYDGALYFGIEGGTHSTGGGSPTITTRETIIYRINLDASNNPVNAVQVYATNSSTSGSGSQTSIHDWGDFIIRNGVIINSNTARNSCGGSCSDYDESKYHHYDMMTGAVTNLYNNPTSAIWNGQVAMTWAQNLYYFRAAASGSTSVVGTYNGAGVTGAPQTLTVVGGGTWPGGAGDASDPFRPKCDFGDAPASYDPYATPATQSPAVHERADTLWIGNTTSQATSWSREFYKLGVNGTADTDNGIGSVPFLPPGPGLRSYLVQASVYNGTTSNARLIAWLDFNNNGTFDAAEAATLIPAGDIAPSASVQTRYLYWPAINVSASLTSGTYTYLRLRFTNAAASMTTSHATGYFEKGEVEDYRIPVDNFPLASLMLDFKAALENNSVKLNWKVSEDANVYSYEIERSKDNTNWAKVATVAANGTAGTFNYQAFDNSPLKGASYYRVKVIEGAGFRYSVIRPISFNDFTINLSVAPNPARDKTTLLINVNEDCEVNIGLLNLQGQTIMSLKQKVESGQQAINLLLPSSISSGVYMLQVRSGEKTIRQKLVVNH